MRGGLGFILKTLELFRIQRRGEGKHFQSHAPAQRNLLGCIDDAHAAAAYLAQDDKIAQGAQSGSVAFAFTLPGQANQLERRQHLAKQPGDLGVALGILLDVGLLSCRRRSKARP